MHHRSIVAALGVTLFVSTFVVTITRRCCDEPVIHTEASLSAPPIRDKPTVSSPDSTDIIMTSSSRGSTRACDASTLTEPSAPFSQYYSHSVGVVPINALREAVKDLAAIADSLPQRRPGSHIFIHDGTLMNALRWGRIVNDNDVEFGFIFDDIASANVSGNYFAMLHLLADGGVIDAPTPRLLKKIWSINGQPKPGRCLMRSQMMQCRHRNGAVMDIFAPWVVMSELTHTTREHVLPVRHCRLFEYELPCPRETIFVLKQFTLKHDHGAGTGGAWYEWGGCTLLPLKERGKKHVEDILRTTAALARCGYPSLYHDRHDPSCKPLFDAVGVVVPLSSQ